MTKNIDTVLFDFDGTLVDTGALILNSWLHMYKVLGMEAPPDAEIISTFGEPIDRTLNRIMPGRTEEGVKAYRSYHHAKFEDGIRMFPQIPPMLDMLRAEGYKMAVVTSRLMNTTRRGLAHFNLESYFEAVITADDTDRHKPDPTPIFIALNKLGKLPENAIMIGDSLFDMGCAKNAGVTGVLVGWTEVFPKAELHGEFAPDFVVKDANDLQNILNGLATSEF